MSRCLMTKPKGLSDVKPGSIRTGGTGAGRVRWRQGGSRDLLVRGGSLASSGLNAAGGAVGGGGLVGIAGGGRRVRAWEHLPKGAVLQANVAVADDMKQRDVGPEYADDGTISGVNFFLPDTTDSAIQKMPEFAYIPGMSNANDSIAALRDARLTLQQRAVEKLWSAYEQASLDLAAGRRTAHSAQMQIRILNELVRLALDQGEKGRSLQNFYAQDKLLHLLETDARSLPAGDLLEDTVRMRFGIGYGLWEFLDDPLSPNYSQYKLPGIKGAQVGRIMGWLERKHEYILQQAEESAFKLSVSATDFYARGGSLSEGEGRAYDRVREELHAYLQCLYGPEQDGMAERVSGQSSYAAGHGLAASPAWRSDAGGLRDIFKNDLNRGGADASRIHYAYYGQLAVASGLVLVSGRLAAYLAEPENERPVAQQEYDRMPHQASAAADPHLARRSPHLQLLMAKVLMRGEGVFKNADLPHAPAPADRPAAPLPGFSEPLAPEYRRTAGGDVFIDDIVLSEFERWNSQERAADGSGTAVAPAGRCSAAQILLKHAACGAKAADGALVSPGLVEAKSLYGRTQFGHPAAEELRGVVPPLPKKCGATEKLYRRHFGWRGASDIDKRFKAGLSAAYGRSRSVDQVSEVRRQALQDLLDAAYSGDCAAMATLIELNLRGSEKMGLRRDIF